LSELLTPTRLFSDPPLTQGLPTGLRFSPDGSFLSYQRAASDDKDRMDLWRVDVATGAHTLWIDARTIKETSTDITQLTEQERAERERRRQFHHGITHYSWHPDGQRLILPLDGQIFQLSVTTEDPKVIALCPSGTRQTDVQVSPLGSAISYVRKGNLYTRSFIDGTEQQLTQDASDTLNNGLPDFLAAEEMHRFSGHWWSPDEQYIAFTKVDEACVSTSHRMEVDANGARTIAQHYPYAGQKNPQVSLWLYHLGTEESHCIWQDGEKEAYLARVDFTDAGLFIQTQDRLQQHLNLCRLTDTKQGSWQVVYAEHSDTWINLNDDFRVLENHDLLVTTERSGTRQALRLGPDGEHSLAGPSHINQVLALDDQMLWVSGWHDTPVENHLFAIRLDGSGFEQQTVEPGWHETVVHVGTGLYLDHFSNIQTPPRLSLSPLNTTAVEQAPICVFESNFDQQHPYTPYVKHHAHATLGHVIAEDGQQLHYRLTPPANITGSHPTIVYVYGGPGPQKACNAWSPLLVQLFAHQGFAVLELDNRGSGNRGSRFEAPIYRQMGHVEVIDQVAGLAALAEHAWADLSRVGIFGHSYGGYMTLMCLAQAGASFRAGVAVAPVSDWALYDSHYTERYMGLPEDNVDGYEQANVLTHLHQLNNPLLLIHGMADDNVLFTHSTMIMGKLQALHQPFELMTYPGAKHSMQERDVSIHRFDMILSFFKRHLASEAP